MKILVLGGDGMLGHRLLLDLKKNHDVRVTLRQKNSDYERYQLFDSSNSYFGIDVRHEKELTNVISDFRPDAIINAIGVVKQREAAKQVIPNLEINALLPHRLALLCSEFNIRLIHISTDCVFSGRAGNYTEKDVSDAEDFYGKAKYLGEVASSHAITLRTSFIGLELSRKSSLIEWFLMQEGKIKGFRRAIYTGLTSFELSRVIEFVLLKYPKLTGVWHVSSEAITKFDLLLKLNILLNLQNIMLEPEDDFVCDRSLNSEAFYKITGYKAPNWDMMLKELAHQIKQRKESLCIV
jgi:dTDP-4-dehydrorhamnose reductase